MIKFTMQWPPPVAGVYAQLKLFHNEGIGNFKSSDLLEKLNAGDVTGAANCFSEWVYGAGKVLQGLVNRREAEKELFLDGSSGGTSGGGSNGGGSGSVPDSGTYVVQSGDTLSAIVVQFNTTVADLESWNGISDSDKIYVAEKLCNLIL